MKARTPLVLVSLAAVAVVASQAVAAPGAPRPVPSVAKVPPATQAPAIPLRIVPVAEFSPALKDQLKGSFAANLAAMKPATTRSLRLSPATMAPTGARVTARNLLEAGPEAFVFKVFPTTCAGTLAPPEERGLIEIRLSNLGAGTAYMVDCSASFRASQLPPSGYVPAMPTYSIARNGAVASEVPPGSSLNDSSFHLMTAFVAVEGDNVLQLYVRGTPGGGRPEDGRLDWLAAWNGCDIEALR